MSRRPVISATGVVGVKAAGSATKPAAISVFQRSTLRKPKRRRIGGATNFMAIAPTAAANVIMPDWNGGHAEAELQEERQQERRRAHADAEQEGADQAVPEGRQPSSVRSRIGFV